MDTLRMRRKGFWRLAGLGSVAALGIAAMSPVMADNHAGGAVYTQTNSPEGNLVVAFHRHANGSLAFAGTRPTGGIGTGGGLGNQGAVALSENGKWLLVINAGSNDISVFAIGKSGLQLTDREPSGGIRPISVTVSGRLVYVLNAGSPNNISGFWLTSEGNLSPITGSTRPLSGPDTVPAQVSLSRDGELIAVTEKATSVINTYAVDSGGVAHGPYVHASAGATPFGFAFGPRNQLFVSEAFGGATDASAVSSYSVTAMGDLHVITPSALTTETAACWMAVTGDGRFAYAANAGSASISGFRVRSDGRLTLLSLDGVTGFTGAGSGPLDLAVSHNSRYLYVLLRGTGRIGAFSIGQDGSLTAIDATAGALPPGVTGLAAR